MLAQSARLALVTTPTLDRKIYSTNIMEVERLKPYSRYGRGGKIKL